MNKLELIMLGAIVVVVGMAPDVVMAGGGGNALDAMAGPMDNFASGFTGRIAAAVGLAAFVIVSFTAIRHPEFRELIYGGIAVVALIGFIIFGKTIMQAVGLTGAVI